MKYYSLTVKNNYGNLHAGECFCNAVKPLTIGQLNSSNIILPCLDDLLPQNFCTIKATESDCWILIKQTDFYPVKVNDKALDCACHLSDGNVISLNGISFVFNVHDDDNYVEAQGIIRHTSRQNKKQIVIWCCSLFAILAISIGYPMLKESRNSFTSGDDNAIRASLCKLEVEEVILQRHTPEDKDGEYHDVDSYLLENKSVGTCFLTTDSLIVTARHCVEPWLDFNGWEDNTTLTDLPQDVYWAVIAERSQLEQADTLYRVVSKCQIITSDSTCIDTFTSDQFSYNRSRDIISHMGTERLPWRVIYPLYHKKDVELGDFAFIKTKHKGELTLATMEYLSDIKDKEESGVRIYGFPKKIHGNRCEYQEAALVLRGSDISKECIQLKVNGTTGYSGAPVIEKRDGRMLVVGVFSKIDDFDDSKNTFYAVPANEISQYNPIEANEKKQYRR